MTEATALATSESAIAPQLTNPPSTSIQTVTTVMSPPSCDNHTPPCSHAPNDLSSALFPNVMSPIQPWAATTIPSSPVPPPSSPQGGRWLRGQTSVPLTPEQRQRRLQSILETALDIMSSLEDDVDDIDDDDVDRPRRHH